MTHILNILKSGGLVMIPLGLLSLVALAIVIERLWVLRAGNYMRTSEVSTLREILAAARFSHAIDYCKRSPGPFTDLVATLVENRHAPYDELKQILEVFQDVIDPGIKKYVCAPCSNCKGQIRDLLSYYDAWEKCGILYGGLVELVVNAMTDIEQPFIEWEWR